MKGPRIRRTWPRKGRALACLLLLPLLSGCMAGTAAVAVGIASLAGRGGGGGGAVNQAPAALPLELPSRLDGEHVAVRFHLVDDDGGPLDVTVEWQPLIDAQGTPAIRGGQPVGFLPATEEVEPVLGLQSDGTRHLMTEPNKPRETLFLWKARSDIRGLLGKSASWVLVRIQASEEGREGDEQRIGPFLAGNDPPEVKSVKFHPDLVVDPKNGAPTGLVPFVVSLFDSTEDPVTIEATYQIGAEDGPPCPMSLLGADESTFFPTSAEPGTGKEAILLWKSVVDLGTRAIPEVSARIRAHDRYDPDGGAAYTFGPFLIDNNRDPVVQVVETASSPDRSFEIPIRFIVRDDEEDRVSVILQWAARNDPFPDLPNEMLDPGFLADLLAGSSEETRRLREELHILSEAPVILTGNVQVVPDPDGRRARAPDLVRADLVFVPPEQRGPRRLPQPPFDRESDVFLIGKQISFADASGDLSPWQRITEFEPATSTIELEGSAPHSPSAPYILRANGGCQRLSSSQDGLLHTFVWDSLSDMRGSAAALDGPIRIRATGVDSQAGSPSPETAFSLESGPLLARQTVATDQYPIWVSIGDIDADGRQDFIVVNQSSKTVTVHLQDVTDELGVFFRSPTYRLATLPGPIAAAIGDLGGPEAEGKPAADLVVLHKDLARVTVYLQAGGLLGTDTGGPQRTWDGEFGTRPAPTAIALGDVDGDGGQEILIGTERDPCISIYRAATADGRLIFTEVGAPLRTTSVPRALALGDVDGDGRTDVVAVGWEGPPLRPTRNSIDIFLGTPSGMPGPGALTRRTDYGPVSVATGDVNGDGRNDIAVASQASNTVTVYCQGISGEIPQTPTHVLRTESKPVSVAIGEFGPADDGRDGLPRNDVAVANAISGSISIYLQDPSAGSPALPESASQVLPTEPSPCSMATGDIDGDGRSDLVVASQASHSATVYVQQGAGSALSAAPSRTIPSDHETWVVLTGDLNADGLKDIALVHPTADRASLYLQSPEARMPSAATDILATGSYPIAGAIGDVSGDGRNDLLIVNSGESTLRVYLQDDEGGLVAVSEDILTGDGASSVAIGDIDSDGRNDVVIGNRDSLDLYVQDGEHRLRPAKRLATGDIVVSSAIGDVNGDGRDDLIVANKLAQNVSVYHQGQDGRLPSSPTETLYPEEETGPGKPNPAFVTVADMNGDGRSDVVLATQASPRVSIYRQDPSTGSLGRLSREGLRIPSETFHPISPPDRVAIGDVNGDGRVDILVVTLVNPNVFVYLQKEDRSWPSKASFRVAVSGSASSVVVEDLNRDGRNDVLMAIPKSLGIQLFYGR